MGRHLTTVEQYSYAVLASISVACGIPLILAHFFVHRLRKSPGMLIFWQILGQTLLDLHWVIVFIMFERDGNLHDGPECDTIGSLSIYSFHLSHNYILMISIEIFHKVKYPLDIRYSLRAKFYHSFWHAYALIFVILAISTDSVGLSVLHSCQIDKGSWLEITMLIPLVFQFPWSLILTIYALKIYRGSQRWYILRYAILVFLVVVTTGIPSWIYILAYFKSDSAEFHAISSVCVSIQGAVLCIYRMFEITVLHKYFSVRGSEMDSFIQSGPLKYMGTNNTLHTIIHQSQRESQRISLDNHASKNSTLISRRSSGTDTARRRRSSWHIHDHFFADVFADGIVHSLIGLCHAFSSQPTPLMAVQKIKYEAGSDEISSSDWSTMVKWNSFAITEYEPLLFSMIRQQDNIDIDQLLTSMNPFANKSRVQENAAKGGNGGNFLYFTYDRKFLLKQVTKTEKNIVLQKLMPSLQTHIQSTGNRSIISRIYGIFTLKIGQQNAVDIILMPNIIPEDVQKFATFDIKGSKLNRQVAKRTLTASTVDDQDVYKDIDFDKAIGKIQIQNSSSVCDIILTDVEFLSSYNIMDYSLLICIISEPNPEHKSSPFVFS